MSRVRHIDWQNTRTPECKPSIHWRANGRLFAVCTVCLHMRPTDAQYWPNDAPWPCKGKELPGE